MIPLYDDQPTERAPILTVGLIVTCSIVFLWQMSLGEREGIRIVYALGAIPAVILGREQLPPDLALIPPGATLVTSMFLHGDIVHLIGNMLFLWVFGNNIEDTLGRVRFLPFYLACGLVAALTHIAPNPGSVIPMIGASGAISGVLGAYLLLHPNARILTLIPLGWFIYPAQLPAFVVLGLWFLFQLIGVALDPGDGPGIAWFAHIGGFVAGVALLPVFRVGLRKGARARRGPWG